MPNTGRPSRNCHTCRKRRVKCDLTRPECQRCLRLGKRCPGYRDEASLLFKNEDLTSLAGSSSSKDRRRSKTGEVSDGEKEGYATPPFLPQGHHFSASIKSSVDLVSFRQRDAMIFDEGWQSPPPRGVPEQWIDHAVPLVLGMLSIEHEDSRYYGQASFLPEILWHCSDSSALTLCCKALGLAFLTNKSASKEAEVIRNQTYGRALAATNMLVSDKVLCQQDEAPASVWILSLYGVVNGARGLSSTTEAVTWSIHAQGLVALLRVRGPDQLQTERGRNIFGLLAVSSQIRSLVTGAEYPVFIQTWLEDAQNSAASSDNEIVGLSRFASNVTTIISAISQALSVETTDSLPWTVAELWEEVQRLETTLNQVLRDYPLGFPVSLQNLYIVNQYRAYHIRNLQYMLDLVRSDTVQEDLATDRETIDSVANQVSDSIRFLATATIDTVPHILGSVDHGKSAARFLNTDRAVGWKDIFELVWPLRIIATYPSVLSDVQFEEVRAILHKISSRYCISQAAAPIMSSTSRAQ